MKFHNQKGFSLVEMLIVCVIVGIISSLGIALFKKAIYGAQNGAAFAVTKVILTTQMSHVGSRQRFARLSEINAIHDGALGTTVDNTIVRGSFTFTMVPDNPDDEQLREGFTVIASRTIDSADLPYVLSASQTGEIVQITP